MVSDLTEHELCVAALSATEGVGPVTIAALIEVGREHAVPLRDLLALPGDELARRTGLPPDAARRAAGLESPSLAGRAVVERVRRLGADVLPAGRPGYPERLRELPGRQAPHVLFFRGDGSLLQRPCIAVVGSRRPSRKARLAADFLAAHQAGSGPVVVSGGARGIDAAAHRAALGKGATIVMPALGICGFRWSGIASPGSAEGRWCVVSAFPPAAPWDAAYALTRNSHIVALSDAVVAFDPRDRGGTWNSCMHALRMGRPLFVVTAARRGAKQRGQRRLVRRGAVALDPDCMPDAPAFARLVAGYRAPSPPAQDELFDGPSRCRSGERPPAG
jgi:DNA processing protein